jgi:hypothetical protein
MRLRGTLLGLVLILALATVTAHAATVQKMDLDTLCGNAQSIFRGTVMSVTEGTVHAGGADLPTVTYTMKVDEAFKGTYETEKGVQYAKITMLGTMKPQTAGNGSVQSLSYLPDLPRLTPGEDYVLMTTAPSAIGLSATVGLGQGCFHISGGEKGEMAVNELGNAGLFDGPVAYSTLANEIRGAGQ